MFYAMQKLRLLLGRRRDPSTSPQPTDGFSRSEVQRAALRMPGMREISGHPGDSFFGGTMEKCEEATRRIAEVRARYANYPDARMRREIMGWCDFRQQQVDEDRCDILTQAHRKEMDAYRAERSAEDARVAQLMTRVERQGGE